MDCDGSFQDDFIDVHNCSDNLEITNTMFDEDNKCSSLMSMGYTKDEASIALERCGLDASLVELTDFIYVAQMSKVANAHLPVEEKLGPKLPCIDFAKNMKKKKNGTIMRCGKEKDRSSLMMMKQFVS